MIRFLCLVLLIGQCFIVTLHGQEKSLLSPDAFLNYELGSRFTPHHLLVDYFRHVAEVSKKVNLVEYGRTYELRPLIAAIVSSPQNLARLDDIRQNNLRRTGSVSGEVRKEDVAIVYLSYSIHGNEAAGSESSMAVLYDLAKGSQEIDKWLSNTIVILDPCLNPDGYSRFTSWSNMVSNSEVDPRPGTREHNEPWPGGRVNHYYFDLNRDWVWLTQKESRDRVAFYTQWMPHVHADLHEMSPESAYFFAPAAQPFHPYVTSWQASFQEAIGKNNASYFDKEGWRYYTKEYFDLFYPSYGDTYPLFSGAIGMTYEQGGGGSGNRAIIIGNGDTLTLADRIAHHRVTSLSTIETSSLHAADLVREFESYFKKSNTDPPGTYKSYVIKISNQVGRVFELTSFLNLHGIKYGVISEEGRTIKGFSYSNGEEVSYTLQKGDIIISAFQPHAVLIQALFEPEATLADSVTYDITAWSVPMAYGLDAIATEEKVKFDPVALPNKTQIAGHVKPYAYALQWGSSVSSQFLIQLLSHGFVARFAKTEFKVDDIIYPTGTILFMRADNRKLSDFDSYMQNVAASCPVPISLIRTGFVQSGKDLGSDNYPLVRKPEVLSIAGEGVSPQSIGQVWHFFEEELKYPVHLVDPDDLDRVNLETYNVIILPEGYYSLETISLEKIKSWIRSGGQLIVIGSGNRLLTGKEGFSIKSKTSGKDTLTVEKETVHYPQTYASTNRNSVSEEIGGAIFQTMMDKTNPLSFGLGEYYLTLKTSPYSYDWLAAEGNAIFLDEKPIHYGFAGAKAMEKMNKSLIAGMESMGNGKVVYLVDNPLFREFWYSGKVLFSNALFF